LGYELECSLIHPIQTLRQDGSIAWVKSSEIKEGDYIAIKGYVMHENIGEKVSTKPFNETQDLVQSKQYQFRRMNVPEYIDEDLAYMIGLWVAEGSYVEHAGTSSSW
jgi:ribonucleoside-diphosphate reductase alpha chain